MATYSKLIELLDRGELKRCYGLVSPDPALRERALDRVRARVLADTPDHRREWDRVSVDLSLQPMAVLADEANTYPTVEGARRCVVARGCEQVEDPSSWSWLEEWFDTRQIPGVHLVLCFDRGEVDTDHAPFARIAKTGRLVDATRPSPGEWRRAVDAEFPSRVLDAGLEALYARCTTLGQALGVLDKIRYVNGHVDARVVEVLTAADPADDAADALLEGRRADAVAAGRHAAPEEVSRCIGLLERRLRDAESLREALRTSRNLTEAARRASIPIFRAKEIAEAAKGAEPATLARRRVALAKADVLLGDLGPEVAWLSLCAEW